MRRWLEKFEAMAVAAAFAESGEWETAQGIMRKSEKQDKQVAGKHLEQRRQPAARPTLRV